MIILYEFLSLVLIIFSPLIILIRILKNKEHRTRFKEKIGFFSKIKDKNNLIWFHCCSVGELRSIIPLIKKIEKKYSKFRTLVTTSTLSSSVVFEKENFKRTIHQFFPLDNYFITKKFIEVWKPKLAIFVESEIWPSMILNLNKKKIPIVLLNARITKKSYSKWKKISSFSKRIFNKINIALPQNKETAKYLKNLGSDKIKYLGNLKFSSIEKSIDTKVNKTSLNKFNDRVLICAASTHSGEDEIFIKLHKEIRKKIRNLLTVIIPRHTKRTVEIIEIAKNHNLSYNLHSHDNKNLNDVYIVDTYGESEKFYSLSKIVFMGGSLVRHGGQNPLEPARLGCHVINGPFIDNFKEVYSLMRKLKISTTINSPKTLKKLVLSNIKKSKKNKNYFRIKKIGNKILYNNIKEIDKFLKNEDKKTKLLG